jgi:hypothetical protein
VLDERGAVWGVLRASEAGARLPQGTSLATQGEALQAFLAAEGIAASAPSSDAAPAGPEALARQAADITVAVTCWN